MEKYFGFLKILLAGILAFGYLLFFAPWNRGTVTVTGTAKIDTEPQIANFSASVTISDDNKDTATSEVNTKMTNLIIALKAFGIAEGDIKTETVSVYENQGREILIYPPRDISTKKWQATNSITIKLRDTSKVSGLTDLLNSSGATSVSGPNFAVDNTTASDSVLLTKAVEDAKTKAEAMAKAGGRTLGRMLTVSESGSYPGPLYALESKANVGAPIEPGIETLSKSVAVTFELK